ncbi:Rho-type gtpase-activating protein [Malassezia cuniculi]|uniref:Rho-type gtpase-activating protein n=1 Tax=Malassezia cuniculi TaxID=948313 RepID=A0AAF0F058_9BASI|nr:Rho-type gtpase-activating protein [Malassezia cuniculi]
MHDMQKGEVTLEAVDAAAAVAELNQPGDTPVCAACFSPISTDADHTLVRMDTQLWHIGCNRNVLGDQENVVMVDGMPLCTSCSLLCSACGQPVTEEAIICEQDTYHPECFCCTLCTLPIHTNVYSQGNGVLYCAACNEALAHETEAEAAHETEAGALAAADTSAGILGPPEVNVSPSPSPSPSRALSPTHSPSPSRPQLQSPHSKLASPSPSQSPSQSLSRLSDRSSPQFEAKKDPASIPGTFADLSPPKRAVSPVPSSSTAHSLLSSAALLSSARSTDEPNTSLGTSPMPSPVSSPARSPMQLAKRSPPRPVPQMNVVPPVPLLPPGLVVDGPPTRIRHGHSASAGMLDANEERVHRPRSGSSPPLVSSDIPPEATHADIVQPMNALEISGVSDAVGQDAPASVERTQPSAPSSPSAGAAVDDNANANGDDDNDDGSIVVEEELRPAQDEGEQPAAIPAGISQRLSELLQMDILSQYGSAEDDPLRQQRHSVSSVASQRSDRELVLQIISAHTGFASPAAPSDISGDESVFVPIENGDADANERPLDLGVLRSIALAELLAIESASLQQTNPDAADAVHQRVAAVIDALMAHLDVLKGRCAKQLAQTEDRYQELKQNIAHLQSEHERLAGEKTALDAKVRQRKTELAVLEARLSQMRGTDTSRPPRHPHGVDSSSPDMSRHAPPHARTMPPPPPPQHHHHHSQGHNHSHSHIQHQQQQQSGEIPSPGSKRLDASLPPLPSPRKFNWIRPRLITGRELAALRPLIKEALLQTPQDAAAAAATAAAAAAGSISDISPPVPPKPADGRIAGHTFQMVTGAVLQGSERCLVCQRVVRSAPELRCSLCRQSVHARCVPGAAACAHSGPPFHPVVFGGSLVDQLLRENAKIPRIVEACIRSVEENGMDYEGIYRKSGSLQQQRSIVQLFASGTRFNLSDTYLFNDPAAVTGALKQYLRELHDPLIPRQFHGRLYALSEHMGAVVPPSVLVAVRDIVAEIPAAHRVTLARVVRHLTAVAKLEAANKMNSRTLGLVFGPTLMRCAEPGHELLEAGVQAKT